MKVFCIIGDERAGRARSPVVFTTLFRRMGINAAYVPFRVQTGQLRKALESLCVLDIAGANITVPYKETVVPCLDRLSEGAAVIGAVNTIVRNGDELKGYNTNAVGFMDALVASGFDPEGKTALLIGTGGAARAVAFIFNWLRTRSITISGRNDRRVKALVDRFGGEAVSLEALVSERFQADIVVNATSVSTTDESPQMADLAGRLEPSGLKLVVDLNYDRSNNIWQELAVRKNASFMDGLLPLAYQARRTFALWTGQQVPAEEFVRILTPVPEGVAAR